MMSEERAAIVAWQLLAPGASIERFREQLGSQKKPEWNKAVGLIADAIRDAEIEARVVTREIVEVECSLAMDLAKEADAELSVEPDPEEYPEIPDWVRLYDMVEAS